jgi:ribosomal protein L37AE/L43A
MSDEIKFDDNQKTRKIVMYENGAQYVCNKCGTIHVQKITSAHLICSECFYDFLVRNEVGFCIKVKEMEGNELHTNK